MLTGILVPTDGNICVAERVPHRERIENARNIGVVFGQRTQLWWDLPVRDSLELLRDMHGMTQSRFDKSLERLDAVLGLGDLLPVMARKLSLGQRMRADLAAALIHEPSIVYLDEPTIGLDISVKDRVRAFARHLVAEGTTVLLTTHDLDDIEDICRRIIIIDDGRLAYDGDLESVKNTYARDCSMHFQLAAGAPVGADRTRDLPVRRLRPARASPRMAALDRERASLRRNGLHPRPRLRRSPDRTGGGHRGRRAGGLVRRALGAGARVLAARPPAADGARWVSQAGRPAERACTAPPGSTGAAWAPICAQRWSTKPISGL